MEHLNGDSSSNETKRRHDDETNDNDPKKFKRLGSARKLYNFDVKNIDGY